MNSKLFAIMIVLACLVVEATCGVLSGRFKSSTADFEALNTRLVDNVPSAALADNLDYVKANINSFSSARVKRAAELLLEVSKMNPDTCDTDVVPSLNEIAQTKLDAFGEKRIERVMREAGLVKVLNGCLKRMENLEQEFAMDSTYKRFFGFFTPLIESKGGKYSVQPYATDIMLDLFIDEVEDDPKARFQYEGVDERTGKRRTVKDFKKFEYALNTYLVEPCRNLLADPRSDLLSIGYPAVDRLGTSVPHEKELLFSSMKMAWRKEACNKYLNMDAPARAKLFRSVEGKQLK